ncbi:hypothetical protein BC828DRAFT_372711 [Blastocladiella britannica]|nr:hypothetical protein BC828DRAFT_372711 [Blastocladiella britannica]
MKIGVKHLVDKRILPNPDAPGTADPLAHQAHCAQQLAIFLVTEHGLSTTSTGRLLGQPNSFSRQILRSYIAQHHLDGMSLESAMRTVLARVRLPGAHPDDEANRRIVEEIARAWCNQNADRLTLGADTGSTGRASSTLSGAAAAVAARGMSPPLSVAAELARAPSPSRSFGHSAAMSSSNNGSVRGPAIPNTSRPRSPLHSFAAALATLRRRTGSAASSLATVDGPMTSGASANADGSLPALSHASATGEWWWTRESAHALALAIAAQSHASAAAAAMPPPSSGAGSTTPPHRPASLLLAFGGGSGGAAAHRAAAARRAFVHATATAMAAGHAPDEPMLASYLRGVYDRTVARPLGPPPTDAEFDQLFRFYQDEEAALRAEFSALFAPDDEEAAAVSRAASFAELGAFARPVPALDSESAVHTYPASTRQPALNAAAALSLSSTTTTLPRSQHPLPPLPPPKKSAARAASPDLPAGLRCLPLPSVLLSSATASRARRASGMPVASVLRSPPARGDSLESMPADQRPLARGGGSPSVVDDSHYYRQTTPNASLDSLRSNHTGGGGASASTAILTAMTSLPLTTTVSSSDDGGGVGSGRTTPTSTASSRPAIGPPEFKARVQRTDSRRAMSFVDGSILGEPAAATTSSSSVVAEGVSAAATTNKDASRWRRVRQRLSAAWREE